MEKNKILVNFKNGPSVSVEGEFLKDYLVEFIDYETNEKLFESTIKNNESVECPIKYYVKWLIKVNGNVVEILNLEGKDVYIENPGGIGDTIAWNPYIVEFKNKHKCNLFVKTKFNEWFINNKNYQEITFVSEEVDFFCGYKLGFFSSNCEYPKNYNKVSNPQTYPLQQLSTNILGLDFEEKNLGIFFQINHRPINEKYIVFGVKSTMYMKEWYSRHWIELAKIIKSNGYEVISLTDIPYPIPGIKNIHSLPISDAINFLYHAHLFIGLSSGLSWINWAIGKHTVMISNFTEEYHEFQSNCTRFVNKNVCHGCWNNKDFFIDTRDLDSCPVHRDDDFQFICQKSITPNMVYEKIKDRL